MPLPVANIDKLAFGGNGVCRIDGKVCFVPFSCPGDEVALRITTRKKSYCMASIAEVITASPFRAEPVCPVFGECGGCAWQHISYPTQLEQKRSILAEALWRGARVPAERIDQVVPAANSCAYRSRLQFKVTIRNGALLTGFFRHGSHQVVDAPADGCPVAVPVINRVLGYFRTLLPSYPGIASVSGLRMDAGDNGVVVVITQAGRVTEGQKRFLNARISGCIDCTGLYVATEGRPILEKILSSSEIFYCMPPAQPDRAPLRLTYPPGGFAQVHQLQNVAMLAVIRMLGELTPAGHLLDLYCGNGNFSLPLAAEVATVTGVEGSADSIRAAERNSEFNRVANIRFICDDAAAGVGRLVAEGRTFDTVLLDPPRAGAESALAGIVSVKPEKIIYVSCDPSTLARDCGHLSGVGYQVVRSIPVDMFPHTYHIESVTLLTR